MTQPTRRPLRRRRSPFPLIIILVLLSFGCISLLVSARLNSVADSAYERLVGPEPLTVKREALVRSYFQLNDNRLKHKIIEDDEAIIRDCEQMNKILGQLEAVEKQIFAEHAKRTDDFKASTRWMIGWTARHAAANEIADRCDSITRLHSELLPLVQKYDALLKLQNGVYMSYAKDELTDEEFTETKTGLDVQIEQTSHEYTKKSGAIEKNQSMIRDKSNDIGNDS